MTMKRIIVYDNDYILYENLDENVAIFVKHNEKLTGMLTKSRINSAWWCILSGIIETYQSSTKIGSMCLGRKAGFQFFTADEPSRPIILETKNNCLLLSDVNPDILPVFAKKNGKFVGMILKNNQYRLAVMNQDVFCNTSFIQCAENCINAGYQLYVED